MTFGPTTPGWDERGCRDVPTSAFYPVKEDGSQLDPRARAACERCPIGVRAACLEDALAESDNADHGYRAGTSAKTRRAMRRRRRQLGPRQGGGATYPRTRACVGCGAAFLSPGGGSVRCGECLAKGAA